MKEARYLWECSCGEQTISWLDHEPEECHNCGSTRFEYIGEIEDD